MLVVDLDNDVAWMVDLKLIILHAHLLEQKVHMDNLLVRVQELNLHIKVDTGIN